MTNLKRGWTPLIMVNEEVLAVDDDREPPAGPSDDPTVIGGFLPTTAEWERLVRAHRALREGMRKGMKDEGGRIKAGGEGLRPKGDDGYDGYEWELGRR